MKRLAIGLFLLALGAAVDARTLTIPPGEEYVVDSDTRTLELEQLIIGDGATIRFADDVKSWKVTAQRAVIGEGVTVDGSGRKGADGAPGLSWAEPAAACKDGKAGGAGTAGSPGGVGVDIEMALGLVSLGDLTVLADGGAGGAGGPGGTGQKGGAIDRCHGGRGGDGGAGGAGGTGGEGGDVEISYWASGDVDLDTVDERIRVSSEGGKAGAGGAAGAAGEGASGEYQKGSVQGRKRWLAGGVSGDAGVAGAAGRPGRSGQVTVAENLKKTLTAPARERAAPASRGGGAESEDVVDIVRQLQRRIWQLEERVEALEKQQ